MMEELYKAFIRNIRILSFAFIANIFLFILPAQGQSTEDLDEVRKVYPDAEAVLFQKNENIRIRIKNNQLVINSHHYQDKMILGNNGQLYTDEYIYFNNTFNETDNITARAYLPKGKRYKKVKVERITTHSKFDNSIFFHDDKVRHIVYPRLEVGSRATLRYRERIKDPHFLGAFFFSNYIPTANSEFSISFPSEVKVKFKLFNNEDNIVTFEEVVDKNITTYTWTAKNIDEYKYLSDAPSIRFYEPHVVVYIDEYEVNGRKKKVLSDVGELYNWYYSLVEGVNRVQDNNLKVILDELIADAETDFEKSKLIFYWVQDNIKYVAFEAGYSGFIPRTAGAVCTKKYGDCKDMAGILVEMFKMADIPASLTWIGTRSIPYTYEELPTPMVDNHMIATLKLNGETYFLDATGQYVPFGMPTAFIQGKEALIANGKDDFEISIVPILNKEESIFTDSIILSLDGNQLKGHAKARYTGYKKFSILRGVVDQNDQDLKDFFRRKFLKGNNKFRIDSVNIVGDMDRDADLEVTYDFPIPS